MISKMNSSIPISLLICMVVLLPWCFRGCGVGCVVSSRLHQDDSLNITDNSTWFQSIIKNLEEISVLNGTKQMSIVSNFEELLSNAGLHVKIGSPEHGQLIDSLPSEESNLESLNAEIIIKASQYLVNSYCSRYEGYNNFPILQIPELQNKTRSQECAKQLTKVQLNKTSIAEKCFSMYYNQTACVGKNLKYRTVDGSCNNLKHSFWGMTNTAYKRLLFPDYDDGVNELRKLSTSLVDDEDSPESMKTIAMAYWATFISHDLSKTALSSMQKTNKSVICCTQDGRLEVPSLRHPSCASIIIPETDKLNTSQKGEGCMNYVRSVPAMRTDCTFGPREQMNVVSHYLDGSMIYGSSVQQTWSLRMMFRGQLLFRGDKLGGYMMPLDNSNTCQYGPRTCYQTGDSRANAQPQMMVMHTLWMREHNRLANILKHMNKHWDDERTFQEARKIVIASIQHITYNEWLPALLGRNNTIRNQLELLSEGYSDAYDETADPSVSNSFATAVLPFVYSMFDESATYYNDREDTFRLDIKKWYNKPLEWKATIDTLIIGLSFQSTQKVDMKFSKTMTDFLFTNGDNNTFGMDVMSLTIQRGRDHGIPSYVEYRKYCGLNDISNERDLNYVMVEGATQRLMNQYKNVKDIELFIGALFEKHEGDAMVGPTMRCLIREQFIRTRIADRYFYDLPTVFSEPQLAEIRKITLARFICDNKKYTVETMQRQVFFKPGPENNLTLCESDSIPKINFKLWYEPGP